MHRIDNGLRNLFPHIPTLMVRTVLSCLLLVAGTGMANAANYYVAKNGNNSNPGTEAQPWLTIQKAASTLRAGDTAYVKSGTYNERVNITVQGSAGGGYITFRNFGADTVILDGTGFNTASPWGGLIQAMGKSYIRIQGFHIRNVQGGSSGGSILISGSTGAANHVEILDNEVTAHSGGNAIGIRGSNLSYILVNNNDVYGCNTNAQEAIRIDKGVNYFTISNNRVHDNTNIGIDVVGWGVQPAYGRIYRNICYGNGGAVSGAHGIYIDGGTYTVIEDNICYGNAGGISVGAEYTGEIARHVIVRRNVMYGNYAKGITTGGSGTSNGKSQDCSFVHNTLYNNNPGSWSTEFKVCYFQGTLLMKNNIIYNTDTTSAYLIENRLSANPENIISDYNCYYPTNAVFAYKTSTYRTLATYQSASGDESHSINQECVFNNAAGNDFSLKTNSPCKDAGDFLTRATGSGSGTVIPVADARPFCDGYGGYFQGDLVQVGSQSPVRITQVNYTNNTITVNQALTWAANDGVSLAYSGSKPDMGAIEYSSGAATSTPTRTRTSTPAYTSTPLATSTPTRTRTSTPVFTATPTLMQTPGNDDNCFVAKNGNDNNPGTESLPWLTIQKAANTLIPGQTVHVKSGTYNERVKINVQGSSEDGYITFRNYGTDTVILDGAGIDLSNPAGGLIEATGKSYLRIQGFHIQNAQGGGNSGGIMLDGNGGAGFIDIRDNKISAHIGGSAIVCKGNNLYGITLDNNEIHNTDSQEAILINQGTYYFTITNNLIYDNTHVAIRCQGWGVQPGYGLIKKNTCYQNGLNVVGTHAIYVDGGAYITIEGNICYNNQGGIAVGAEYAGEIARHVIVRENLLIAGREKGITLGSYSQGGGRAEDCAIMHNTLVSNNAGSWSSELKINYFQGTCAAKNNIIYDTDIASVYLVDNRTSPNPENMLMDYNCHFSANAWRVYKSSGYNSLSTWQAATGQDYHSIAQDPLFNNAATYDFQLQSGSPCRDTGDFLTRTTGSGSGTVIPVADARAFCDGYSGWITADMIQVGGNGPVQISQVNYVANTISVDQALAWAAGDGVSKVYSGSRPDMGAYEFGMAAAAADTQAGGKQKPVSARLKNIMAGKKSGLLHHPGGAQTPTITPTPGLALTAVSTSTPTATSTSAPWMGAGQVIAYPNPAKEIVHFAYTVSGEVKITITIYQISGERVAGITEHKNGGAGQTLTTSWQARGMAPGIYICHCIITDAGGRQVMNKRMKIALVR